MGKDQAEHLILVNGEERSRKSKTFTIPPRALREKVPVGYFVKIGWEWETTTSPNGERMWVKVTRRRKTSYVGTLSNTPVFAEGLEYGQKILFKSEHILDVNPPTEVD